MQMTHRREILIPAANSLGELRKLVKSKTCQPSLISLIFICPFQLFEFTEAILLKTAVLACTFACSLMVDEVSQQ